MAKPKTLIEIIGPSPGECDHPKSGRSSGLYFVLPDESEDWAFALRELGAEPGHSSFRVCWDCSQRLPSNVAQRAAQAASAEARRAAQEHKRAEKIAEAAESGEALHECPDCSALSYAEDLLTMRHCPHCDRTFAAEDGRNCDECNRPFTSLLHRAGCPECRENEEPCIQLDAPAPR